MPPARPCVPVAAMTYVTVDANEAVASVAHRTNEVIAIYPITPASPMGEHADAWTAAGRDEHLGRGPAGHRDAGGRRRRRRRARRAHRRRADHDVHRVAGPAADDPEPVQDRRRAHALRRARRGAHRGHPCAVDLRRPLRRDGRPRHRVAPCSAPARSRRRRTSRCVAQAATLALARALPPLLRRLPHLARGREDRAAAGRRSCGR